MKLGDFSKLAKDYISRPAYDVNLIEQIMRYINKDLRIISVADVGAGTGKLTKVLAGLGCSKIMAVEPNDEMRQEGIKYTNKFSQILWSKGTGEDTGLNDECVDLVTMASSFHWTDPNKSLPELKRILKQNGFLSIMWNTRDVASSKLHSEIEQIIYDTVPNLKRNSSGNSNHTKKWENILVSTGDFENVKFIETNYTEKMTNERYMQAWRSVNDIQAQAGPELFSVVLEKIRSKIAKLDLIEVPYKMRSWTAKRK